MQGSKAYESRLFYQISLDELVPSDHLVRRLSHGLELGWARAATADCYSTTGRPSIDPVVIAKMLIVGFLYNIPSERKLMREIQVNLAYRWYLGYDLDETIPHHSVLSKARRRLGLEFFEQLFQRVLQDCRQAGLIEGNHVLIDSTLVPGNASKDRMAPLPDSPGQYLEQLETAARAEEPHEELGTRRPGPDRLCDRKQSSTDPDATLASKGKTTILGYKTHICADSQQGVITAVAVSTAAADDTSAVPELLEKHQDVLEESPRRVVADGAYGSQECLGYLQERGIETVIPKRSGGNKHGGYDKSRFVYDSTEDVFRCPAGATLQRIRTDRKTNKAQYQCKARRCAECAQRLACLGEKSTARSRTVTRYDSPYEDRAQAACRRGLGRRLLALRHTLLEGLFGQAKNYHGLNRARWRGLYHMTIQSLVIAAVLNLKKLLAHSCRRGAASLMARAQVFFDPTARIGGLYRMIFEFCPAVDLIWP